MSPPPMTLERFSALAEAFGADMRRWPEADRAAARALAQDSAPARTRLAEADALDAALDLSRVASPSPELRQRILSAAPKPRASRADAASARSRLMRWLSGLGAVGVLTCGAMAGAAVVAVSGPSHVDSDSLAGLYDQPNTLDAGGA